MEIGRDVDAGWGLEGTEIGGDVDAGWGLEGTLMLDVDCSCQRCCCCC